MQLRHLILSMLCCEMFLVSPILANEQPPPRTATFKKIGDVELQMTIYDPPGHKSSDKRPAIVFFFGGGWRSGSVKQFENQCKYLASRGMVAMAADYRVSSRHQAKVIDCVADAKSAIRWVRDHAKELGIDPERIAAGGGSAGGHLAAATATLPGLESEGETTAISSRPNALVLFNPALDLAPEAFSAKADDPRVAERASRLGAEPKALSPTHHIVKGLPPTIIFHGKADTTVPYAQAEAFTKRMREAGNRCELAGYEGQAHGFFNFGRGDNSNYRSTLSKADAFLASLGYLSGPAQVDTAK